MASTSYHSLTRVLGLLACSFAASMLCSTAIAAMPVFRVPAQPSTRPAAGGSEKYVDAGKGNNSNNGSQQSPWQTVTFALTQLQPGDTLYLRNGTYREQLTVSINGKPDAPITIRSYPGELATIDSGIKEFFDSPADAWEPAPGGVEGEFRSKHAYPNIRDVVGAFGDTRIGLQTYWHHSDLQAKSELWDDPAKGASATDVPPVYCGPGVYYDGTTGYLFARLADTTLKGENAVNYVGDTSPLKVPLIISTFRTIPLHVDQGTYIRFQDLVIQGGGFDTVVVDHSHDIDFDNVIVYCGTYGMRTANTTNLRFYKSALYGNTPPWGFRTENSLRNRKGTNVRDVARLTGHALWVGDTGLEFSVYAFPYNNEFEISYSTFTDSHDGLYLGGMNVKFHHNVVDNMQDDGIYVSPVYNYGAGKEEIYENYFSRNLTVFAFGGPVTNVKDSSIYIYRNIVDMRSPVRYGRPSTQKPELQAVYGNAFGDHGSPPWPTMHVYQNTFITGTTPRHASMGAFLDAKTEFPRSVINNAFIAEGKLPAYAPMLNPTAVIAGNLFWGNNVNEKSAATYFTDVRKPRDGSALPPPPEKSLVADPKFVKPEVNDFRLQAGSPLINAGVELPANLPDPLRSVDQGAPDIGALPLNAEPMSAGVTGHINP